MIYNKFGTPAEVVCGSIDGVIIIKRIEDGKEYSSRCSELKADGGISEIVAALDNKMSEYGTYEEFQGASEVFKTFEEDREL